MMTGLVPVLALLIIVTVSAICVKIGSVAFRMTGLDQDTASFQSLSAFSGTGFTTREAESVTKDRRRRKIAKGLMIAGNAGMAVAIATLFMTLEVLFIQGGSGREIPPEVQSFHQAETSPAVDRPISVEEKQELRGSRDLKRRLGAVLLAVVGGLVLYRFAVAHWVNAWLSRFIERRLARVTDLAMPHYARVLQFGKGYGISEIRILDGHTAIGKTLKELAWAAKGVLVLTIERGTDLISTPHANTKLQEGDEIVCYGPIDKARRIAGRKPTGTTRRLPKVEDK